MRCRPFALLCIVTPLALVVGCSYELPMHTLAAVPPARDISRLNGTYDDHSPSEFGGSLWEMLTGDNGEGAGTAQTRIQTADDGKLIVARIVNGVESGRRAIPFRLKDGYLRLSRPEFFTLLVFSKMAWDEVAITAGDVGDLEVYQEKGSLLFLTLLPLPVDTGPPPNWRRFSVSACSVLASSSEPGGVRGANVKP